MGSGPSTEPAEDQRADQPDLGDVQSVAVGFAVDGAAPPAEEDFTAHVLEGICPRVQSSAPAGAVLPSATSQGPASFRPAGVRRRAATQAPAGQSSGAVVALTVSHR